MPDKHPSDIELLELAEGDLESAEAASLRAHVETCPNCAESLRLMDAGKASLQDAPMLELPPSRLTATLGALGAQEARVRSPWLAPRRALAVLAPVAAVVALAVIVTTVEVGGSDGDETAAPAEAPAEPAATAPAQAPAAEESASGDALADESLRSTESFSAPQESQAPTEAAEAAPEPATDATDTTAGDGAVGDAGTADAAPPPAPEPAPAPAPAEEAAPAEEVPEEPAPAEAPAAEPAAEPTEAAPMVVRSVAGPPEDVVETLRDAGLQATLAADGDVEVAGATADEVIDALAALADGSIAVEIEQP